MMLVGRINLDASEVVFFYKPFEFRGKIVDEEWVEAGKG